MFKRKNKQPEVRVRTPRPSAQNSSVFSYYASRSRTDVPTGRYQEAPAPAKRGSKWKYIPSYIAAVALLIAVINIFTLSTHPRVVSMAQKTPNILRDNDIYEEAGQALLSKSIWSRSKLTVDTNYTARELQRQFPEIESVVVTMPLLGNRPVIQIAPAEPSLIMANQTGAYVIDEQGRALLKVRELPLARQFNLPTITDDIGIEMQPGSIVLPQKTVQFISVVKTQLAAKNITIDSLSLPAVANELHVRIKGEKYFVKFNLQDDARQQAGAFIAVKGHLKSESITPSEYIDVRIEDRAYYK
ncbi:MAG: hypothetical protein JWL85_832 [Candidatus Saccharibacteria bacterium]|nr:hypothetical protein [Candidatus Saccharibacteria bacterium]